MSVDMSDFIHSIERLEPGLYFTGVQINYYFICKRKLWLFSNNMGLESESDLVFLGKLLHEQTYKNKRMKEVTIERIKIDFIDRSGEIHEVKRSKMMESAHVYQLLYYIYFMKHYASKVMTGVIDYPLLRKRIVVELDEDKERELQNILRDIDRVVKMDKPPNEEWKRHCKSCSYRELCWC